MAFSTKSDFLFRKPAEFRFRSKQNQSNSPRYNSPSSTQEAETPSPKSTQPHQPLPETTRLVNGTSTESESRTGAVVVAAARGLVSLVLADPVSVAGVVAASRNGGSSTNPSVRAEARVLVSSENTNEVLESGDKGKSEESVVAERDGGDAAARGRSSGGSKASQQKIKNQIQYNPLRFPQSPFNHHYKSIERGARNEESNTNYAVKAVTVPSSESESEASNSKSIVESVKDFMVVLYQFIYPYTVYARTSAAISASLIAVEKLSDISPLFFIGLLQAVLPHLFIDLYVNGVNQLFDFEIDKINKPHLPLASGKLSFTNGAFIIASSAILGLGLNLMIGSPPLIWNCVLCFVLITCYSVNLPFLRWKQYPVVAGLFTTISWTLLFPISYFLHMQTFVLKRPLVFTRSFIVSLLFLSFYSAGIALAKDIPDVEGDTKHGIDSFAARLGQKKVFWICVFLLEMAFGIAFLAGASSSSPFWIKFVTGVGNVVLGSILWNRTKYIDVTSAASTKSFYSFIWKLMMVAHLLLPLIR
ncbi:glycinol 4-dimethylallyltransferase-like [Vigna unguiculata]|uniref:glycinol 4-dimethylallyltransferase-like n=1 Tax=Vigna unguiculata TaxID=3917 RepID=UPI001016281C|nr:glycinol 4-dimethylallyltransferase-like [Vigna unguiculata]